MLFKKETEDNVNVHKSSDFIFLMILNVRSACFSHDRNVVTV